MPRPSPSALRATRTIPSAPRSPPCCPAPTARSHSSIRSPAMILTVIPSDIGHAVPAERDYAEFAALPTASGLVISPYADDLSVVVANGRVTITRPGGLSLTPPMMPASETPAAMAAEKNGPSFLDFAAWGPLTGGSFLATERRLMQSAGAAAAGQGQSGAPEPGALLSRQPFRRRGAGPDQPDTGLRSRPARGCPAFHHAGGGRLHDGPLSRRP